MLLRINLEYLEFTLGITQNNYYYSIILSIDLENLDYIDYIDHLLSHLIYSKPAFGDSASDEEDVMLDDAQLDQHDEVQGNCDAQSSTLPVPPVPSKFDMVDFMHQSSTYNIQQVLQQAEDLLQFHPMFSVNCLAVKHEEKC